MRLRYIRTGLFLLQPPTDPYSEDAVPPNRRLLARLSGRMIGGWALPDFPARPVPRMSRLDSLDPGYRTVFSALPLEKACGRVEQFNRDRPGDETDYNKA